MNTPVTDKRRQILDAALALCAEDGLQGAATARIAKAAGVANGTLFHHFPSKELEPKKMKVRLISSPSGVR